MMERMLARALISAGLMIVVAVLGLTAVGFFLTAIYLAVLPLGQPWLAPAITGGVALLVALVILGVVATGRRKRRPIPQSVSRSGVWREGEVALALGQDLEKDVERWFQAHRKHAVVAALAAGFAFGASPRLRQTVRRLLGN
jgi:ABC-type protease/lipase transport system fused ATPase/permease subunit